MNKSNVEALKVQIKQKKEQEDLELQKSRYQATKCNDMIDLDHSLMVVYPKIRAMPEPAKLEQYRSKMTKIAEENNEKAKSKKEQDR